MLYTGNGAFPATPSSAFADKTSWGYQVVGKLDYNNLFAGINFSPSLGFAHDVKGNTPLPLGNSFTTGRRSPSARNSPSKISGAASCGT